MTIYIIRHAEPDYARDSLTEKGWREAALLSHRLARIPDASYYVSPLGRARDTASLTLKAVGKTAEVLPWLREFDAGYRTDSLIHPRGHGWDFLPSSWTREPMYYDPEGWMHAPAYKASGLYAAVRPNTENLLLFCHFGVECVLLSRLFDCSPVVLWHHTVALPSSVTVVTSEEREPGTAIFRMSRFGDLSHLDAAGEAPSFSARFCERHGDGTREEF